MKRRIGIILCFILTSILSVAQPYCNVKTYSVRDGLAANNISGIEQDINQLIWFGTRNGLCCFDGYRFTTFRDQPGVGEVLSTNRLLTIKPNSQGDIWCATYDKNLYLFNCETSKFVDVTAIIKRKFGVEFHLNHVYPLKNGHTWVTTGDAENLCFCIDDVNIKNGYGIEAYGKIGRKLKGNVRKVSEDSRGNAWLFTENGVELPHYRIPSRINFEYFLESKYKNISHSRNIYLASDRILAEYHHGAKDVRRLPLPAEVTRITSIIERDKNYLALGTNVGVVLFHKRTHQARVLSMQNPSQPSALITFLYLDSRGAIWAFTEGNGVTRIDRQLRKEWLMATASSVNVETTSVDPFVYEDRNHTVWVVPNQGTFSYYDEHKKKLVPYVLTTENGDVACEPSIDRKFFDYQGNMWFTSTHDLTLVNFNTHRFQIIPIASKREVRSVCALPSGLVYAGLNNGWVASVTPDGGTAQFVGSTGELGTNPYAFSEKIYAIYHDSKSRLWMGDRVHGIYLKCPGNAMQHLVHDDKDKYSLGDDHIYDIFEDSQHRIWVATYGGGLNLVQMMPNGKIRFLSSRNVFKNYPKEKFDRVRRITETRDGLLIASTTDGLLVFDGKVTSPAQMQFHTYTHIPGDSTSLETSDVLQTCVTRDGHIYVVTMSGSLQVITEGNLLQGNVRFKSLRNAYTLGGITLSVVEDGLGNLWLPRENSLECYHPKTGDYSTYGAGELGGRIEFSEAKPFYDSRTDRIVLGAMGGLVIFHPRNIQNSSFKPRIVFTSAQFNGESEPQPILYTKVLEIPSDKRNLTISFSALDYHDNYLIHYAYKMEGVDKSWNYVGSNHCASYNHLPAGHYKLLVKSTNADGMWMDNVTTLMIHAQPTFWETIWAKILYVFFGAGLLYLFFSVYSLRKRAQLDAEMDRMKTSFFTEIGHKLRTPLTLIGGPVTQVLDTENLSEIGRRQLDMVQRNSRQMLALVNRMLDHNHTDNYLVDDASAPVFSSALSVPVSDAVEVSSQSKSKLLIVEDNNDLRSFLTEILRVNYEVISAENGKIGLQRAVDELPDFIITDVMMPVMDGLSMVHQIKQNKDICHIPVIVLSAKASLEDRLQGLQEGIDDYITKPFSATYLKRRIENIISQRHALQQSYLEQITPENSAEYKLESPQIVDADQQMMKTLMNFLEDNIGNPELRIDDLASAVNLGRTVFYEKIKSIVGMTPVDFVRHVRMQRAEELVARSKSSFSEIAYAVGFSDPKYFSKCFKKETGMSPSEYREKVKK